MTIYCDKEVAEIDPAALLSLVVSLCAKTLHSQSCPLGASNILSHKQDTVYGEGEKQVGVSLPVSVKITCPCGL